MRPARDQHEIARWGGSRREAAPLTADAALTDSGPRPGRPLRIACVYRRGQEAPLTAMDGIRFRRMSEALARRGHEVDVIVNRYRRPVRLGPRLRTVPFRRVEWNRYDVIKTFFHRGFQTLVDTGGADHPFIVSKLGSVVGREQMVGVHFFGAVREELFRVQAHIAQRSRLVTVLTDASAGLWRREHGTSPPLLQVRRAWTRRSLRRVRTRTRGWGCRRRSSSSPVTSTSGSSRPRSTSSGRTA